MAVAQMRNHKSLNWVSGRGDRENTNSKDVVQQTFDIHKSYMPLQIPNTVSMVVSVEVPGFLPNNLSLPFRDSYLVRV